MAHARNTQRKKANMRPRIVALASIAMVGAALSAQDKPSNLLKWSWTWSAKIESTPPGAEVFAVSDEENKVSLGKTPLTVEIYINEVEGTPGETGRSTHDYKLPVRRTKDGFYCGFQISKGEATTTVLGVFDNPLDADAQGGPAHDLRQGKYILFKPGRMSSPFPIAKDFSMPKPLVNRLSVTLPAPEVKESKTSSAPGKR